MKLFGRLYPIAVKFLSHKVPIWSALILSGVIIWLALRPPQAETHIQYVDRIVPEKPRVPLRPYEIVIYSPVIEFRLDSIEVPVNMGKYYLVEPGRVSQSRRGVTMSVYDPELRRYEDWIFRSPKPRFALQGSIGASRDIFTMNYGVDARLEIRYKKIGAFASAEYFTEPRVLVGVRYYFWQ